MLYAIRIRKHFPGSTYYLYHVVYNRVRMYYASLRYDDFRRAYVNDKKKTTFAESGSNNLSHVRTFEQFPEKMRRVK